MFDPFDEKHRDKVARRKPSEIAFERKTWQGKMDRTLQKAIEELGSPRYVQSNWLLNLVGVGEESPVSEQIIRVNFARIMGRLGWIPLLNVRAKNGRWWNAGESFYVFCIKGCEKIEKAQLARELGW